MEIRSRLLTMSWRSEEHRWWLTRTTAKTRTLMIPWSRETGRNKLYPVRLKLHTSCTGLKKTECKKSEKRSACFALLVHHLQINGTWWSHKPPFIIPNMEQRALHLLQNTHKWLKQEEGYWIHAKKYYYKDGKKLLKNQHHIPHVLTYTHPKHWFLDV